jgi:hypothetical protein
LLNREQVETDIFLEIFKDDFNILSEAICAKADTKKRLRELVRIDKEKSKHAPVSENIYSKKVEVEVKLFDPANPITSFVPKFNLPTPIDVNIIDILGNQNEKKKENSGHHPKKTIKEYMESFRKEDAEELTE